MLNVKDQIPIEEIEETLQQILFQLNKIDKKLMLFTGK